MSYINKILIVVFFMSASFLYAQTPGMNYQAIILNNAAIEIPGTDVQENQVPLGLTQVTFRFYISNENEIEYTEDQTVMTDENGMISLIVGEGTPVYASFNDIVWDGKLKSLNVEINILSNNEGFVFLDTQKILYIPHPTHGTSSGRLVIINNITNIGPPPYENGTLIWVKNYEENENSTLLIYNGTDWVPVASDYDPTNELGLIVVADADTRDTQFNPATVGDQVWNQASNCIEVYNGTNWVSLNTLVINASNGLYEENNTIKLGGDLEEPTTINTSTINTLAIKNLEESTAANDDVIISERDTGVLKKRSLSSFLQQKQVVLTAINGQLRFTTPLPISSIEKLDVYRNGARISFIMINETTIELETEAICYEGDQIRIVQVN